jgi:hypothetical protein
MFINPVELEELNIKYPLLRSGGRYNDHLGRLSVVLGRGERGVLINDPNFSATCSEDVLALQDEGLINEPKKEGFHGRLYEHVHIL